MTTLELIKVPISVDSNVKNFKHGSLISSDGES